MYQRKEQKEPTVRAVKPNFSEAEQMNAAFRTTVKNSMRKAEFLARIFDIGLFEALEDFNRSSRKTVRNLSELQGGQFGGLLSGKIVFDL